MLKAWNCKSKRLYVPFRQRIEDDPAAFWLLNPDLETQEEAANQSTLTEMKGTKLHQRATGGTSMSVHLRKGVKGWVNMVDEAGQPLEFKGDRKTIDEYLSMIDPETLSELHSELTQNTRHLKMLEEQAIEDGYDPKEWAEKEAEVLKALAAKA